MDAGVAGKGDAIKSLHLIRRVQNRLRSPGQ
jgi:hypothetical protein